MGAYGTSEQDVGVLGGIIAATSRRRRRFKIPGEDNRIGEKDREEKMWDADKARRILKEEQLEVAVRVPTRASLA